MDIVECYKPDMYAPLCDGCTDAFSSKKRISKSMDRSATMFHRCLERHKQSHYLSKNSSILGESLQFFQTESHLLIIIPHHVNFAVSVLGLFQHSIKLANAYNYVFITSMKYLELNEVSNNGSFTMPLLGKTNLLLTMVNVLCLPVAQPALTARWFGLLEVRITGGSDYSVFGLQ